MARYIIRKDSDLKRIYRILSTCFGTNLLHIGYFRRRSMHSAALFSASCSSPARMDICPPSPPTLPWISLGWQCGKLNEPIQIDICQVSTEISEWQGLGLKVESTCNAFKFQPRASGEVLALTITYQDVPLNGFATNTWVQLGTTMLSYLFVGSSLGLFSVCTGD